MAFAESGLRRHRRSTSTASACGRSHERRSYLVDVPAERYEGSTAACRRRPTTRRSRARRAHDLRADAALEDALAGSLLHRLGRRVGGREPAPGQLVVLQSTTYPGTTEEMVLPILERSGGKVGQDFFLGYAPERVDPGNRQWHVHTTPKLVARRHGRVPAPDELLYRQIVETVVPVSSPMVAETAKLHENTFRAVNIALANELCAHVRPARHLGLGGHRGGGDQAVRLPAALPGPRARRRLHPGRAALPRLAPARVRLLGAADRGRARGQRAHADLRGAEDQRRAERRRPPDQGLAHLCCWGWRTSPTCTTPASRRASRSCASSSRAAATCATATRGSPTLELDGSPPHERRVVARGGRARPTASSC